MVRRVLPLALAALAALGPVAPSASAAPSAAARLAHARSELGQASMRLAQARSLGDHATEARAAGLKARLVRREAALRRLADAERVSASRRARVARARREAAARVEAARAAQLAAAVPPPVATSPYAPHTALAASAGPPPPAETLVPLLDGYLASRQSPLTGMAATFVAEGSAAGVDPRFLVAIAGAETSFAVYGPSQAIRNPFGLGPHMAFGSWEESIRYAARNLAGSLYAGDGRFTIPAIQGRWAPDGAANDPTGLNSNWTRNVSAYFAQLGGDPAAAVIGLPPAGTAGATAAPSAPEPAAAATPPVRRAAERARRDDAAPAARVAAEAALGLAGTPYALGGGDARGIDGPGLVRAAWGRAGVALPGSAAALAAVGAPVPARAVRAGDAVLLSGDRVGVYLGGGRLVWVPGDGLPVTEASFEDPETAALYRGARRFAAPYAWVLP